MTDLQKLEKVFQEIGVKYSLFKNAAYDDYDIEVSAIGAEAHFIFDRNGKFKEFWAE
jgi:hypothetical protein